MIHLKPVLETLRRECPNCHSVLTATDWLITGMRNLADFHCSQCKSEFYGDLPAGQALYTPILLDKKTGAAYDDYNVGWFSGWLADSYAKRSDDTSGFEVRKLSKVKNKVLLLNCLDTLYGHSLLKLLNAQHYIDYQPDVSLIVILPPFLEWMLPDGVAEAWIVDLPLRRGTEWSDWLAAEISERVKPFSEVFLSVAFSHPRPEDFDIERFTRVPPFPLENLGKHHNKPVITFIWREDRLWETENPLPTNRFENIKNRLGLSYKRTGEQSHKVVKFAGCLRAEFPQLDFGVAGLGEAGGLPDWISDLRSTKIDVETERRWCGRYAESHLVIGVHGSNMLLPSAHAGGVIELIGADRQGNFLQDILLRGSDPREMFFRYRFVPHSTAPEELARLTSTILRYEDFQRLMGSEFSKHREKYDLEKWLSRGSGERK